MAAVAEREQEQEVATQERTTSYIVLTAPTATGPWTELGTFAGRSQKEAKRAAVTQTSADPNAQPAATELYFIAISASSYKPEKPTVKTTTSIAF